MTRSVVLLGPQRFGGGLADEVASLDAAGPIATVTAGWQEREGDDDDLQEVLDGAGRNLALHARWLDIVERDPEFADADQQRRDLLDELQEIYLLRLHHAIAAVAELDWRVGDPDLLSIARGDAVDAIRDLDERHLARVAEVHAEFHDRWPPHERDVIAAHRDEIAGVVAETGALAIAGGHVGELVRLLHLFNVAAAAGDRPVIAWSAGAMAIAERVVLFHDLTPHGPGHAEVLEHGLGIARGIVPLPHASSRLRLDDHDRMALMAARFAPRRCVLLDAGARVACPDGECGDGAPAVAADGTLTDAAVAA